MGEISVRLDADEVMAAARTLGVEAATPAEAARFVVRNLAGTARRHAAADGGAAPKRAGRAFENQIVEHANAAGFPWDRAPLRGRRDLLDVTGCLPDGWLLGAKSTSRGVSAAEKLYDAMDQAGRAMAWLADRGAPAGDVVPFQIIQRPGAPVGRSYAVTEYDWFLRLARERRELRKRD